MPGNAAPAPAPGWQAALHLGYRVDGRKTVLAERRRQGPLAVQRPFYPESGVCHTYLLHPPGGIVGGDGLRITVNAATDAQVLITTPGAAKFYRSAGTVARIDQQLDLADNAALEWLPQENIYFPGAMVDMHTALTLHGDARLIYSEVHCLGRPANAEPFNAGRLDLRLSINRDGAPLLLERLRVDPMRRRRSALLAGRAVSGTLVMSHGGQDEVDRCRELLESTYNGSVGVTLLDDLVVVRYLGDSTEQARRLFVTLWHGLRPAILGRVASEPRIWAT